MYVANGEVMMPKFKASFKALQGLYWLQEDGGKKQMVTMFGKVIQNISDFMYNIYLVI